MRRRSIAGAAPGAPSARPAAALGRARQRRARRASPPCARSSPPARAAARPARSRRSLRAAGRAAGRAAAPPPLNRPHGQGAQGAPGPAAGARTVRIVRRAAKRRGPPGPGLRLRPPVRGCPDANRARPARVVLPVGPVRGPGRHRLARSQRSPVPVLRSGLRALTAGVWRDPRSPVPPSLIPLHQVVPPSLIPRRDWAGAGIPLHQPNADDRKLDDRARTRRRPSSVVVAFSHVVRLLRGCRMMLAQRLIACCCWCSVRPPRRFIAFGLRSLSAQLFFRAPPPLSCTSMPRRKTMIART